MARKSKYQSGPSTPWGSREQANDGGQEFRNNGEERFDFLSIIFSIIAGIAGGYVALIIYDKFVGQWFTPLLTGVVLAVFFAVYAAILIVIAFARGTFPNTHNFAKRTFIPFFAFTFGLLAAGFLFEFLYELQPRTVTSKASSYILVLDNSDSMGWNDPDEVRFDAVDQLLADVSDNFPYAVYTFDATSMCNRPMATNKEAGVFNGHNIEMGGGTNFYGVFELIADDFNAGKMAQAGNNCKILFLTDGVDGNIRNFEDLEPVLSTMIAKGVTISTIGIGEEGGDYDGDLLREIADKTGGVYVPVEDVNNLGFGMKQAMVSNTDRNLLDFRNVNHLDWLYFIERTLFMGIVGFAIGVAMLIILAIDRFDLTNRTAMIKGALAGLVLELMFKFAPMTGRNIRMAYFILVALILGKVMKMKRRGQGFNEMSQQNANYMQQDQKQIPDSRNLGNGGYPGGGNNGGYPGGGNNGGYPGNRPGGGYAGGGSSGSGYPGNRPGGGYPGGSSAGGAYPGNNYPGGNPGSRRRF